MSDIVLTALDGSNPLAFLAALGTLRLLSARNRGVRLHWRAEGVWRPILSGLPDISPDGLCQMIMDAPSIPASHIVANLGKDLTVPEKTFKDFVHGSIADLEPEEKRIADFAVAFGSEVCRDEKKDRIQFTRFCFITGSGHQSFIETASNLLNRVTASHIHEALFGPWRYNDSFSMRWDPADAREYALRWGDPGKEGARSVWGMNRLAVEALPLFPTYPNGKKLLTTGFRERKPWPEFTWPLWTSPASCDTVRSLVALCGLHDPTPDRASLRARGIEEVFRVQQVRIGQGANFKLSFRPARSV